MLRLPCVLTRLRLASILTSPSQTCRPLATYNSQRSRRLIQDVLVPLVCNRPQHRTYTTDTQETENLNVSHSRFLAEKSRSAKWKRDDEDWGGETDLKGTEDFDNLAAGKGV